MAREWEYQDLLFCIEFYLLVIFAHSVEYALNKLVVGDSNINLPTNMFNQLKLISKNKDGMLVITETKLDSSLIQFIMDGLWQPYHLDKNSNDRGVIIFAKEANSSKSMSQHTFLDNKESICIDINLTKTGWLLFGSFYP